MSATRSACFALADAQQAKLFRCATTPTGHCHVEQESATAYETEGHEHGRPTPLAAKTGHSYAPSHHDAEEDERRFAQQVVHWLERETGERGVERLTVFTPPHMLGRLRKVVTDALRDRLEFEEGELINLSADELHEHPAVLRLIGLTPAKS